MTFEQAYMFLTNDIDYDETDLYTLSTDEILELANYWLDLNLCGE